MPEPRLRERLRGIYLLAQTPMQDDFALDLDRLSGNIDHCLTEGVAGVVVGGTYAEFPSLDRDERSELFRAAASAVAGRAPLICCTASSNTREVIALGEVAAEAGADGVMVTPPYVAEVRFHDVRHHFQEIARATELPIMIYNSHSTGVILSPEQIADLATIDAIVGLKQGVLDPPSQVRTLALVGEQISVLCGSDGAILGALANGMAGCTSTLANFMASEVVALEREVHAGKWQAARARFYRWQPLRDFADRHGQPAVTKAAMALLGFASGPVRPPFRSLDKDALRSLEGVLEAVLRRQGETAESG